MKHTEINETLKSKICWIVMALAVLFLALLMKDEIINVTKSRNIFLTIIAIMAVMLFFALFAVSLACTIKITKDRIKQAKSIDKKSMLNILLYIVGFTTLQTCFMSGVCGVNLALPILAMVFPMAVVDFMSEYGLYILIVIDILLFFSLMQMKCFKSKGLESIKKISFGLKK